jgi:hypothetical protein
VKRPTLDARVTRVRSPLPWAALLGAGVLMAGCAQTPPTASSSAPATAGSPAAASTQAAPERNTAVIDRLKQMSAYLRTLKTFQVTAQTNIDEVLDTGQKIQFGGAVGYRYVSPDKLHAVLRTDRIWRDFYYDGKTLTQAAPRMNYYASVPATGTVGSVVAKAASDYAIEMPLADLFTWGMSDDGVSSVKGASLIGPAPIGGVDCDHFALRQDGVDWQIWVQKGAQPLPRKMVITTTDEPQQPQYSAVLTWSLNVRPSATEFTYKPPKGAVRITQAPVKADAAAAK